MHTWMEVVRGKREGVSAVIVDGLPWPGSLGVGEHFLFMTFRISSGSSQIKLSLKRSQFLVSKSFQK